MKGRVTCRDEAVCADLTPMDRRLPGQMPPVAIVSDNPESRGFLESRLPDAGYGVETYDSAGDALDGVDPQCACVVIQLAMDGPGGGLALLAELRKRRPNMPVIMVTNTASIADAVAAMRLGAADVLCRPVDIDTLAARVRAAAAEGRRRAERQERLDALRRRIASLTARETEMLHAVVDGKSSKQIAHELDLSPRTVENFRSRLLTKTGAQNTAELVRITVMAGLS